VQDRSRHTRARLVDATRALLVAHGIAGTSTAAVAAAAEVSQGALFKHFPTKPALLAAAVEQILADLVSGFSAEAAAALAAGGDPVTVACAALWRIFRRPELRAVFELYLAARTDDALAARLAPILERHHATILGHARTLFPAAAAANPEFDGAVDAIVFAMQGAALGMFSHAPAEQPAHLDFLERLARRELDRRAAPARRAARRS
jgi:AcrR family transcriptional regulator